MNLKDYLQTQYAISSVEADKITSFFKPLTLKKKAYFLRGGNVCRQIAFIETGVMRNFSIDQDGNEITNYMTSDGDFNTVYHYFNNQQECPENIQAVTDCQLMVVGKDSFESLKAASPTFGKLVDQLVLEGLECKAQRIKSYLTEDAQIRYKNLVQSQPKIIQFSPMQYIASYLGITRETLSRIRNRKVVKA